MKGKSVSDLTLAVDATLGERVNYYRRLRGYTQEYLALACGTSTSHIRQIEKDKCSPRAATIEKVAEVLEIKSDVLVRKTEDFILEARESEFMENLQNLSALYGGLNEEEQKRMTVFTRILVRTYQEF